MGIPLDKIVTVPRAERSALELWVGRALQAEYEGVIHEPLPRAILEALPPPPQG